ncbi:MAG TPA: MFS transporter [Chthoniobacterales bacterium]|jgi:multidrug resistance protein|nr:MFS transporter [Chthoniobacterales bacterium]
MSPLFVIFFTVFIDMVGFGIVIPVLPLYAEHFRATPVEIGWLTGIYSGMQIIFVPILGRLSDRFGRRPILIVSLIGTAVGFLIMGWATSLTLLFAARIIDGASGGNIATAQAYVADVSTPENRSRSMGVIGAAFGLGFTFGPMIGGLLSRISYGAPFFFAAALAAVNVVLLYFILPESLSAEYRAQPHERARLAEVFQHGNARMFGTIVATYLFTITGFAIMTTLFALFTEKQFGFDARHTGYVFGFIGILSVILQGGLIGRLIKRFGETALARTGLLLLAVALALLPLVPTIPMLLAVCAALAIANGLVNPTLNGLASQMIDRSWQGRALGVMQSAGSVGRLVGPLLGGWLLMFDLGQPATHYARTPFFAGAAILFVAFVLAFSVRKPAGDKIRPSVVVEADV